MKRKIFSKNDYSLEASLYAIYFKNYSILLLTWKLQVQISLTTNCPRITIREALKESNNILAQIVAKQLKVYVVLKYHQRSCRAKHEQSSAINSAQSITNESQVVKPQLTTYENDVNDAYEKMTVWKRNIFKLPKGHQGKDFINEMTKQVNLWNTKSPMRHLSLKCLMIMPNLLLQQTSYKSTASENKKTLDRRLSLWKDQKISEILGECLVIQSRLNKPRTSFTQDGISQSFHKLMIQGKVNAAIRLLSHSENSGVLPLNEETMQELQIKHLNQDQSTMTCYCKVQSNL